MSCNEHFLFELLLVIETGKVKREEGREEIREKRQERRDKR
jgi:hypothetical protein